MGGATPGASGALSDDATGLEPALGDAINGARGSARGARMSPPLGATAPALRSGNSPVPPPGSAGFEPAAQVLESAMEPGFNGAFRHVED